MNSGRKGAGGEREVQSIFADYGYQLQRDGTQTFGRVPDLYGADGLHLEIKRAEKLRIPEWIKQSRRDADGFLDGIPTVIFRRSREPWYIVLPLDDFLLQFYTKIYPVKK